MADLKRKATAVWKGDLKNGTGNVSAESGVLKDVSYSFRTRFENSPGTNPEELIASAHGDPSESERVWERFRTEGILVEESIPDILRIP